MAFGFIEIVGVFESEMNEELSQKWKMSQNFLLGAPGDHSSYKAA